MNPVCRDGLESRHRDANNVLSREGQNVGRNKVAPKFILSRRDKMFEQRHDVSTNIASLRDAKGEEGIMSSTNIKSLTGQKNRYH